MRIPERIRKEAEEAVARGARLLDERRPRWFRQIEPATLNLSQSCNCVLGQIYGDYSAGLSKFERWVGIYWNRAGRYGFTMSNSTAFGPWVWGVNGESAEAKRTAYWRLLDRLWKAEVKKRLAA